jgi:hypothetical protein
MTSIKATLSAVAFALAGFAVHANAAVQQSCADDRACFQLAPTVAENGSDKTPLVMWIESRGQMVAEGGSEHTRAGMAGERQSRV